jgi:hypothetical protein
VANAARSAGEGPELMLSAFLLDDLRIDLTIERLTRDNA